MTHAPSLETHVFERVPSRRRVRLHQALGWACSLQAGVIVFLVVSELQGRPWTLRAVLEWLGGWALALSVTGPLAAYGSLLALIVLPSAVHVAMVTRARRIFGRAELRPDGIEFRISFCPEQTGKVFVPWSRVDRWRVTEAAVLVHATSAGGWGKPLTIPVANRDERDAVVARLEAAVG
jgi:hypothetical protein